MPSLIIILLIARFIQDFDKRPRVRHMLSGLRPAAMGLIAAAFIFMFNSSLLYPPSGGLIHWKALILLAIMSPIYARFRGHPALYLIAGALCGILFF